MRKPTLLLLVLAVALQVMAQQVVMNRQHHFPHSVPAGNYSGITWLGGNRYAVVNDKSPTAGFYLMTIRTDSITGDILEVRADTFLTSGQPNRDEEGICYVPQTIATPHSDPGSENATPHSDQGSENATPHSDQGSENTLFVSGERDGQIIEYNMDGQLTGRQLDIPEVFRTAYSNRGFEALTYNAATSRFWTTTENALRADHGESNKLRLQSFGNDLKPREQYWYQTDSSAVHGRKGQSILGVSGLAALDDGQLIVLEREVWKARKGIGSFVHVKLYVVHPASQQPGEMLQKRLLTEFRTRINLTARSFANYEGLCVGPALADGRQLLVLVADSQNQYKGWLKDWFKTIVVTDAVE